MGVRLKFLRDKETFIDPFGRVPNMWFGKGDVQLIEDEKMGRHLAQNHPDIWALVEQEAPENIIRVQNEQTGRLDRVMVEENGQKIPLSHASRATVVEVAAKQYGLNIPDGADKVDILTLIANIQEIRDRMNTGGPPKPEPLLPERKEPEVQETQKAEQTQDSEGAQAPNDGSQDPPDGQQDPPAGEGMTDPPPPPENTETGTAAPEDLSDPPIF